VARLILYLTSRLSASVVIGATLVLTLGGASYEAYELRRLIADNQRLNEPEKIGVTTNLAPELALAKALSLQRSGKPLEAIQIYGPLLERDDAHLRARVHYNLGTLYLQDAAKLWKERGLLEYVRINNQLAAAKENLHAALGLEPGLWDARYNLEYAFRITPPPKEQPKTDFQGSKSSVFATLPSIPGGGP
jgi:mxaK protein